MGESETLFLSLQGGRRPIRSLTKLHHKWASLRFFAKINEAIFISFYLQVYIYSLSIKLNI